MSDKQDIVENSLINSVKIKVVEFLKFEIVQELFYAGVGTLPFILIFSFFPRIFWEEPYRNIIVAIIVLSFFFVFIIFNRPNAEKELFKTDYKRNIILFTIFNLAILIFLFFRTEFGPNGVHQDNFYRSAFITQMAYSGIPQDFAYKGFSAFMAPLYWYILALIAKIFHIKPYKMVKIGFLLSYYILPILLYESWKKIFNSKKSFFITASFFTFVANYLEIIWMDHMISYMFFIPFFVYYFENYSKKEFSTKDYIIAGLIGSLLISTFYLYFILVPIYLSISLIQDKVQNNIEKFREKLVRIFYISIFIIIFSSWFWIPLTLNIIFIGLESHQNLFFPKYALDMPFQAYLEFNLFGLLLLIGVIFIIMKYKSSFLLKILGNLVLSVYILYLLGYIGLLIGFPIVHYRVLIVSHYILIVAFALFYIEFFQILKDSEILTKYRGKINIQSVEILIFIILIFYQSYENSVELYKSDYYERSINEDIPDEVEVFSELDYEDKVFLTEYYEVAAFLPIYLFIVNNPHLSHPSSLNNERIRFLKELSECDSAKEFYKKIMESKFGPIDYFILEPCGENETEYLFDTAELEYYPERMTIKVYFNAELFESESYFERSKSKGIIIYKTIY